MTPLKAMAAASLLISSATSQNGELLCSTAACFRESVRSGTSTPHNMILYAPESTATIVNAMQFADPTRI
jgi:hypothetical protein